ncbi:hypothetical protein K504DRAFT_378301 [Pleomassaria siparia CBS 279.74]|uniref:C2H2-type domain-containing protein n=1 Tax=Pleomassaria siparia CBS 279.74 TaxID=1314801 RepID=A0A6G1KAM7_9PLEO|nr:hypothetical protein K504DRAFT_378301 [Pleomassaria siparia CBS 279.74]
MLSSTREARPTATELKEYLMAHIHRNVSPTATECHACHRVFFSLDKAREHFQRCPGDVWTTTYQTKDTFPTVSPVTHHTLLPSPRDSIPTQPLGFVSTNDHGNPTKTRGEASTPDMHTSYTLNKHFSEKTFHPPPCAACLKTFHSKRKLYTHLYCGHHVRRPKYVHNKLSQNRKRWPRDNGHIGDTWSNRTTMYMQETPSYRQDYPHNPQGDSITGLPIIHT